MPSLPTTITDSEASTILVLCRTSGQAASVRARLMVRGGGAGIAVATPESLAQEAFPTKSLSSESPGPVDPPTSALLDRIGDRPGLRQLTRQHAAAFALHHHEQVGGAVPAGAVADEIAALADSSWVAADTGDVRWLLDRLARRAGATRPGPTDVLCFDEVFAIGFGFDGPGEAAFLGRWAPDLDRAPKPLVLWHARILELLRARPAEVVAFSELRPVPSAKVPDPAAEARLAIRLLLAGHASDASLILVPDEITAARVAAAGRRNGVQIGQFESAPLSTHALAGPLRVAQRWFESGRDDPPIRAADLDSVLTHPLVGASFPKSLQAKLDKEVRALAATDDDFDPDRWQGRLSRLSRRETRKAIRDARIGEAPLSRWIERLTELDDPQGGARRRRRALLLGTRLGRLQRCVTGRLLAGSDGSSSDDDLAVPTDLPPTEKRRPPLPGTLGALRRFLLDCRHRIWDDPIGQSLLVALHESGRDEASINALANVLDGRGQTGRLVAGVEILRYEDYDGRASDRLVLLGMHGKGIGASGTPDPLLSTEALAEVGVLVGSSARLFRLLQARRAIARAGRPFAVISRHDSTGRATTPPLEIELDFTAGGAELSAIGLHSARIERDSYGLALPSPEASSRGALTLRDASCDPPDGEIEAGATQDLADQATAEWCRAGRGPRPQAPSHSPEDDGTLAGKLATLGPVGLPRLAAYLGEIGEAPEPALGWLPSDKPWSVSRHFGALTNCLYRFFVDRVLEIHEDEAISDELDPTEIGSAVHAAIEHCNPVPEHGDDEPRGLRWRVPKDELEQARAEAAEQLRVLVDDRLDVAIDGLGHSDPAVKTASDGLRGRWRSHWTGYVATRVRSVEALQAAAKQRLASVVRELGEFDAALESFRREACSDPEKGEQLERWCLKKDNASKLRKWLVWATIETASGAVLSALDKSDLCTELTLAFDAPLRRVLLSPEFEALVASARPGLDALGAVLPIQYAPIAAIEPELPFGRSVERSGPRPGLERLRDARLRLSGRDIAVSGEIDRVLLVDHEGQGLVEVLDYKTGAKKAAWALRKQVRSLELPQLPVYALVLTKLLDRGEAIGGLPAGSKVVAWAYDYVRDGSTDGLTDGELFTAADRERVVDALDYLVGCTLRGSFPPVPLVDVSYGAGSSFGWPRGAVSLRDVCRFEASPGAPLLSDDDEQEDDS